MKNPRIHPVVAIGICLLVVLLCYGILLPSEDSLRIPRMVRHKLTTARWRVYRFFGVQPTDPAFVAQQRQEAVLAYVRKRAEAAAKDPNVLRDPNWRIDPNEVLRLGSSPPGTLRR